MGFEAFVCKHGNMHEQTEKIVPRKHNTQRIPTITLVGVLWGAQGDTVRVFVLRHNTLVRANHSNNKQRTQAKHYGSMRST